MADVRFEPAAWPPSIRQRNCPCARATAAPCQKLKCRRRMSGAKNIGNAMPSLRVLAGRFTLVLRPQRHALGPHLGSASSWPPQIDQPRCGQARASVP